MTKTRKITTYYEDSLGAEHDVTVDVRADGLRDVEISDDLPDMPAAEFESLRDRVREAYWALESEDYERGQCALEGGLPGHPEDA
jgi:hypothetical protein